MNLTHVGRAAHRSSRPWIGLPAALALLLLGIAGSALAAPATGTWVETWGQAMVSHVQPSPGHEGIYAAPHLRDATVRQIVRVSVGGQRVRVRLSNVYGSAPLTITAASVAPAADAAGDHTAIEPAHGHALRFGGKPTLTIPAGATALSDPIALAVPALSNLVVSLYFHDNSAIADYHAAQTTTTTAVVAGNALRAASLASRPLLAAFDKDAASHIYVLEGVEVEAAQPTRVIVAFGDSITDGAYATAPDKTWPGVLATLANRTTSPGAGVINTGIGGNELTSDQTYLPFGPAALKRFERDVIDRAGVTDVIVLLGTNDLNRGIDAAGQPRGAAAHDIIDSLRMLADAAHAHHLRIHGGTIPPFAGFTGDGWYSPATEATRQSVNQWIRSAGAFDSVVDFSPALAGAYNPSPLAAQQPTLPEGMAQVCAGDTGLHPNDRGYAVMGTLAYNVLFHAQEQPAARCH
ncbi:GDSL-type esterase/lipase family protein [Rhodanobacter ginsenosidimutans]|uniref:GDSL-type esterase/lipase family protein n=1 Tax=Rhodanobacter ginsenosidimutans TaxID=490571 RepID=A0ABW0JYB2_9GAMM